MADTKARCTWRHQDARLQARILTQDAMDLRVLSAVIFPSYHFYQLQAIADGNEHHLRNNSQDRQTRHLQEENVILKEEMQRLTQQLVSRQSYSFVFVHRNTQLTRMLAMLWNFDQLAGVAAGI